MRNDARRLEAEILRGTAINNFYRFVEYPYNDQVFKTRCFLSHSTGEQFTWNRFGHEHDQFAVTDFERQVKKLRSLFQPTVSSTSMLPTSSTSNQPIASAVPTSSTEHKHDQDNLENDEGANNSISLQHSPLSLSKLSLEATKEATSNSIKHKNDQDNLKNSEDEAANSTPSQHNEDLGSELAMEEEEESDIAMVEEESTDRWIYSTDVCKLPSTIPEVSEQNRVRLYQESNIFTATIISYLNENYKLDQGMQTMSHVFMETLNMIHEELPDYFYEKAPFVLNVIGKQTLFNTNSNSNTIIYFPQVSSSLFMYFIKNK